VNTDSDSPPEH